ncbi:zinc finger mynd-type protein, partial [Pyrenophora tritici-repentis]
KGPVIAYGIKDFHPDSTPRTIISLNDEDARNIISFKRKLRDPIKMVDCVRLNCNGDIIMNGRARCEIISLPKFHAIFRQNATPTSMRMKLPITVASIPGSVEIWDSNNPDLAYFSANHNEAADALNVGCDENDYACWGFSPLTWDDSQGSCIVARKDKKPLHPDHVAALAEYCSDHLTPIFQMQIESEAFHWIDGQIYFISKQSVLDEITKDKFEEFFRAWKARQTHPGTRQRISPYDV